MKRKNNWAGFGAMVGMMALILDGRTALAGAREGVVLCLVTVIPSLFPFFLLSHVATGAFLKDPPKLLGPVAGLLGLPRGCEALTVSALLGGYPAGAQGVAQGVSQGRLTRDQGERLLPVCNQPGPAFLFGMVAQLFPGKWAAWALWAIVILSAAVTARILPAGRGDTPSLPVDESISAPSPLRASLSAMASVCGWVVLFRVVLALGERWMGWLLPGPVGVALAGVLELSNGCLGLGAVGDLRVRFCLAAMTLAFGGLCVGLQTRAVAQGLGMKGYWMGKLLQAGLALGMAGCLVYGFSWAIGAVFLIFLPSRQKRGGNSPAVGV